MNEPLPRGIWFDADRQRYRIRRYRNGQPFVAYRETESEAREVFKEITEKIESIPKRRRGEQTQGIVPVGTFSGLVLSAKS